MASLRRLPLCPSAQPHQCGARVFAVVEAGPDGARLGYLERPIDVSAEVLALAGPVAPTEVMRFAADCAESRCRHFRDDRCSLASRIVQLLPAVTDALPACRIRAECRWFREEGAAACARCPQIATETYGPSDEAIAAAEPPAREAGRG